MTATFVVIGISILGCSSEDDGGAGGASASHPICDAYIECVAAAQPGLLQVSIEAYGANGSCWSSLSEQQCVEACKSGRATLAELAPDVVECESSMNGSGGAGAGGANSLPDGLHFLAMSPSFSAQTPFVMTADVQHEGTARIVVIQPLDAMDRKTPVGSPFQWGPYDESLSKWAVGGMTLPGAANPLTGTEVEFVGVELGFEQANDCGSVAGDIVSPANFSLAGSTFSFVPIASINEAPEPPTIDCQGTLADPL